MLGLLGFVAAIGAGAVVGPRLGAAAEAPESVDVGPILLGDRVRTSVEIRNAGMFGSLALVKATSGCGCVVVGGGAPAVASPGALMRIDLEIEPTAFEPEIATGVELLFANGARREVSVTGATIPPFDGWPTCAIATPTESGGAIVSLHPRYAGRIGAVECRRLDGGEAPVSLIDEHLMLSITGDGEHRVRVRFAGEKAVSWEGPLVLARGGPERP